VVSEHDPLLCRITGTDQLEHLVTVGAYIAVRINKAAAFRTLCRRDVQQAPLTTPGQPCPPCLAEAEQPNASPTAAEMVS
jgi:hypothetical protein